MDSDLTSPAYPGLLPEDESEVIAEVSDGS